MTIQTTSALSSFTLSYHPLSLNAREEVFRFFIVHSFNTHFIPTKWPMNYSIFTGRIYKWEFIEDRPLEYEGLRKSGELEKLKTGFPNIMANFLSGAAGLATLTIGLATVILTIWAPSRYRGPLLYLLIPHYHRLEVGEEGVAEGGEVEVYQQEGSKYISQDDVEGIHHPDPS